MKKTPLKRNSDDSLEYSSDEDYTIKNISPI